MTVIARADADRLLLIVEDDGSGGGNNGFGIRLRNVVERLSLRWHCVDSHDEFAIFEMVGSGTERGLGAPGRVQKS